MFPNEVSEFIFTRTYARWKPEEKRRETWTEATERYISFIQTEIKNGDSDALLWASNNKEICRQSTESMHAPRIVKKKNRDILFPKEVIYLK